MNENIAKITDVIHGTIYLSEIEREIKATPLFNRLHYVSQTSTVYLTYPSNNSKRFDHSIGTMKLCGDIFYYGMSNASEETINSFFQDFKKEIKKILSNRKKKMPIYFKDAYGDEELAKGFIDIETCNFVDGLYKQYIPTNIEKIYWNYFVLIFESIRVCGMLHDIGHPPFSHIVENGLNNAYYSSNDNSSLKKALKNILKKGNELHEELGNVIFAGICHSIFSNIRNKPLDYRYFYILVLELSNSILCEKSKFFKDIHRIVAGSLDGDRLDNINRDSYMTGFDKNIIEYNRFINTIVLIGNSKEGYEFCPDIKTLVAIEECFSKRWKNYRCMTHHHRVVKTNYMLQTIVYYLSLEFCEKEKTSKIKNNNSIFHPYNISGLWEPILETNSNKMQIIRFIQWNDNWLLTVLQKKYLEMFLHEKEDEKCTQLYYFLEELIENKKNYNSLIKRYEDYLDIDLTFKKNFSSFLLDAKANYNKFNDKVKSGMVKNVASTSTNIAAFIKSLVNIDFQSENGAFLSSKISYLVSCFLPKNNLFDDIGNKIISKFFNKHTDIIDDCFLVSKKLKIGTDNLLCLFDPYTNTKKRFIDVSHINETLHLEQSYIPEFFVYIKWKNNKSVNNSELITYRNEIGEIAASCAEEFIKTNFMKYLQL